MWPYNTEIEEKITLHEQRAIETSINNLLKEEHFTI